MSGFFTATNSGWISLFYSLLISFSFLCVSEDWQPIEWLNVLVYRLGVTILTTVSHSKSHLWCIIALRLWCGWADKAGLIDFIASLTLGLGKGIKSWATLSRHNVSLVCDQKRNQLGSGWSRGGFSIECRMVSFPENCFKFFFKRSHDDRVDHRRFQGVLTTSSAAHKREIFTQI